MILKVLAAALLGLEATDGFLTMWAINNGFVEVNPLVAPVAHTWVLPAWKLVATIGVLAVVFPLVRRFPRVARVTNAALLAGIGLMAAVLALNVRELIGGP